MALYNNNREVGPFQHKKNVWLYLLNLERTVIETLRQDSADELIVQPPDKYSHKSVVEDAWRTFKTCEAPRGDRGETHPHNEKFRESNRSLPSQLSADYILHKTRLCNIPR